jgi:predicted ArsR family transcriptional regulator
MDSEAAVKILTMTKTPRSVSELVASIKMRNKAVIAAVAEMEKRGLVEKRVMKGGGRGRPRVIVSATVLGEEYLKMHNRLGNITLKATPTALRRATADAEYASRLRARGLDPFKLFLELNEHVRSAKGAR